MTWNDFEYNLKGSFAKLREQELLYDISLACEGQILPAHQVVLGTSSPQLLQLIVGARGAGGNQHPLLVLRGISATDMQLILEFIYTGQVVVPQHQLNTFLASAEDLEILGLSKKCANIHIGADLGDDYDFGPLEALPSSSAAARRNRRLKRKRAAAAAESYDEPEIKQENGSFDEVKREKRGGGGSGAGANSSGSEQLLLLPISMSGGSGGGSAEPRVYECESCNKKFARKAHLQRHEKAHSDFRPFVCTICEQKFKRKEHCFKHISTIHDIDDPTTHTEEIKLSEVLDAMESVNSDEESLVEGVDLSKETNSSGGVQSHHSFGDM